MPLKSSAASLLALLLSSTLASAAPAGEKPQHVVISFDGAHEIAQWERSRALAQETGAHFTYFLSCVYLLSPETRTAYSPPGMRAGRSNVGFAASRNEVAERLEQIWTARAEGHEIASHGCGHFDGKDWSAADWKAEFGQFTTILRDAYLINDLSLEPAGWRGFAETEIAGFRAPYLSTGPALDSALTGAGMAYDASTVSRDPALPARKDGLWRFALPLIPEGPSERRIIAMDYNLFVRHSGGFERDDADGAFEERTYRAFMNAFEREYRGDRTPLQIGFHFTLMNGGAYWRALERFARDVCPLADVRCESYRALIGTLDTTPAAGAGG
jgi:peptidoglycan/xylan/chitin deacetylase (PgdA/CDA1 family)